MISITTHPATLDRFPLEMSLMTLFCTKTVPPSPRIRSMTPCQNSNPARVTMNEGSPILVMIVPYSSPIKAQTTSAARIAAHQGHPIVGFASSATTTPPTPGDVADREVDLAEQQRIDLAHGQQREDRPLHQQVDQVPRREEVVVHRLEQDGHEQQPGHDRQDAGLPATHPRERRLQILPNRVRDELGGNGRRIELLVLIRVSESGPVRRRWSW